MVRWIGGPHAAEHCVNGETFARPKETCIEENFNELVQVFTKGSPTCINAECSQENHHACRERSNHSVIDDNQAMVTKTLLKEMNQGRLLMLDVDVVAFLEDCKKTSHHAEVAECLERTACTSALASCDALGRPDGCQVGALTMEKFGCNVPPTA
jgi:hypothetical protein